MNHNSMAAENMGKKVTSFDLNKPKNIYGHLELCFMLLLTLSLSLCLLRALTGVL